MHTAIVERSEQGNSELSARREILLWGIENIHEKFLAPSLVGPVAGRARSCVFFFGDGVARRFFFPLLLQHMAKKAHLNLD